MPFAGVSLVGDVKPSHSASVIKAGTASGYHLLVVDGYSRTKCTPNGMCIKSRPFTVGGHRWRINYYPNGDLAANALDEYVAEPVKVQFEFSFIDQIEEQESTHVRATKTCDVSSHEQRGYTSFIRREALERSKHLKDDCFTIRCDLIVTKDINTETKGPPSDICQHFKAGEEGEAVGKELVWLKNLLFGPMEEGITASVIQINDMEAQVFRGLLSFVYTDSLPEMEIDDMEEDKAGEEGEAVVKELVWLKNLLVAADRYDLQRLKIICEREVCTVATILAIAEQHHCRESKEACLEFLKSTTNLQEVLAADGLDHITRTCPLF